MTVLSRPSSKRSVAVQTVYNDAAVFKAVTDKVGTTITWIWGFCFEKPGNNRSSAKTDLLHGQWRAIFQSAFGSLESAYLAAFETATETLSKNGTTVRIAVGDIFKASSGFNVDILVRTKADVVSNQAVVAVQLLKAPLTSINKNANNNAGAVCGEICRFYGNDNNRTIEMVFVNLVPRQTFAISDKGGATVEQVKTKPLDGRSFDGQSTIKEKLPVDGNLKDQIYSIEIRYDIVFDDIAVIKNKEDLAKAVKAKAFKVENVDIGDLVNYVKKFVDAHSDKLGIDSTAEL